MVIQVPQHIREYAKIHKIPESDVQWYMKYGNWPSRIYGTAGIGSSISYPKKPQTTQEQMVTTKEGVITEKKYMEQIGAGQAKDSSIPPEQLLSGAIQRAAAVGKTPSQIKAEQAISEKLKPENVIKSRKQTVVLTPKEAAELGVISKIEAEKMVPTTREETMSTREGEVLVTTTYTPGIEMTAGQKQDIKIIKEKWQPKGVEVGPATRPIERWVELEQREQAMPAIQQKESLIKMEEVGQHPLVQASYILEEGLGFGTIFKFGETAISGKDWAKEWKNEMTGYAYGLSERQIPKEGILGGVIPFEPIAATKAGASAALILAGGGVIGKGAKFGAEAVYGGMTGLKAGETIRNPTLENMAGLGLMVAPVVVYGGAKAVSKGIGFIKAKKVPISQSVMDSKVLVGEEGKGAAGYTKMLTKAGDRAIITEIKSEFSIGKEFTTGLHILESTAKTKGSTGTTLKQYVGTTTEWKGETPITTYATGILKGKTKAGFVEIPETKAGFAATVQAELQKTIIYKEPRLIDTGYLAASKMEYQTFSTFRQYKPTYTITPKSGLYITKKGKVINYDTVKLQQKATLAGMGTSTGKLDVYRVTTPKTEMPFSITSTAAKSTATTTATKQIEIPKIKVPAASMETAKLMGTTIGKTEMFSILKKEFTPQPRYVQIPAARNIVSAKMPSKPSIKIPQISQAYEPMQSSKIKSEFKSIMGYQPIQEQTSLQEQLSTSRQFEGMAQAARSNTMQRSAEIQMLKFRQEVSPVSKEIQAIRQRQEPAIKQRQELRFRQKEAVKFRQELAFRPSFTTFPGFTFTPFPFPPMFPDFPVSSSKKGKRFRDMFYKEIRHPVGMLKL